ncbi:hypothetical protein OHA_1_04407 [Pleomorphomonas sp. SM30]|nr:hypothetical protein OHA_1_04407 [Pleomorphomonas sp. SM30]
MVDALLGQHGRDGVLVFEGAPIAPPARQRRHDHVEVGVAQHRPVDADQRLPGLDEMDQEHHAPTPTRPAAGAEGRDLPCRAHLDGELLQRLRGALGDLHLGVEQLLGALVDPLDQLGLEPVQLCLRRSPGRCGGRRGGRLRPAEQAGQPAGGGRGRCGRRRRGEARSGAALRLRQGGDLAGETAAEFGEFRLQPVEPRGEIRPGQGRGRNIGRGRRRPRGSRAHRRPRPLRLRPVDAVRHREIPPPARFPGESGPASLTAR